MAQFVFEYRLYLILAIATVFGYLWLSHFKEKLRIKEWMALVIAVIHTLVGLLFVKVFAFLEGTGFGGMSLYGAVFFLPLAYFGSAWLTKRSVADVFDIFTISTIVTLLLARTNCLMSGCCMGIIIPGTEAIRFPTREAELLFYILLYIVLGKKEGKHQYAGKIYPYYMISYGIFRFAVEFLRESEMKMGPFHISHLWSLLSIAIGALAIYMIDMHKKENKPHSKHKK